MAEDWEEQFDRIEAMLDSADAKHEGNIVNFLGVVTTHFKGRAIANAPIDTQALRDRMEASTPHRVGDTVQATVGTDVDYGLEIHEAQQPEGDTYGLGKKTREQPPTPEGSAGGGFLRRVSDYHVSDYNKLFVVMMAQGG